MQLNEILSENRPELKGKAKEKFIKEALALMRNLELRKKQKGIKNASIQN